MKKPAAQPKSKASSQPIDQIRTEVSLPVFPLEHRCSICAIYHRDPATFTTISEMLLTATPREDIVKFLAGKRIKASIRALYRHYSLHVLPYIQDILKFERQLRMEMRVIEETAEIDIGAALVRKLAADCLAALRTLNLPGLLARIQEPELAVAAIHEIAFLCDVLAKIDRSAAEIALKEQLVELRKLELTRKGGDLDQIASRIFENALRKHPDLARQVRDALHADRAKALPAPKERNGKSPTSTTSSRSRRSRTR